MKEELPAAAIVRSEHSIVTDSDISVAQNFADFKKIRGVIFFFDGR